MINGQEIAQLKPGQFVGEVGEFSYIDKDQKLRIKKIYVPFNFFFFF